MFWWGRSDGRSRLVSLRRVIEFTHRWSLALIGSLAWCAVSWAQETPPVTFSFDILLVSTIQASSAELQPRADEVEALLRGQISQTVVVIDMAEAPRFSAQDIDARTYILSCPAGQYPGCIMVVGQRAGAEYSVGGTLEPAGGLDDGQVLTVHFVDVKSSEVVVSFGVTIGGERDVPVIAGVAALFDQIVQGAFDIEDLRGDLDDPAAQARITEARERLIAASLDELEESLGELVRGDAIGIVEAPKLTKDDLEELRNTDDVMPWQRVGMKEREYLRFSNSGFTLAEWRRRSRGRFGQVLLGAGGGGGSGPFTVRHEGRYLKSFDEATELFYVSQIDQFQELRNGTHAFFEGELSFGVASFAEIGAFFGGRSSPISYVFDQDREGEPSIVPSDTRGSFSTAYYGVRAGLIPFPVQGIRPTAHVGLAFWKGIAIPPELADFKDLPAPSLLYLQVMPGAELSAGKHLNLYARGVADIPVGGRFIETFTEGPDEAVQEPLQDLVTGEGSPSVGFGIQLGFQVRLTVIPDKRRVGGPLDYDDEEDDPF